MKNACLLILSIFFSTPIISQHDQIYPRGFAPGEQHLMPSYLNQIRAQRGSATETPPDFPVRTMAEWEELQGLVITWTSFTSILREIVRHASQEVTVYIVCSNPSSVSSYLASGGVDDTNVEYVVANYNSIWVRDYGPNSVYGYDVDSLIIVDWIYNRPRPADDAVPTRIAEVLEVPIYTTTLAPLDLVHTGGNFMSDGMGTGFSSNLVVDENGPNNNWGQTIHDESEVKAIMQDFMGIDQYALMENLPYDLIHHIDMHMKLLDERTLLVGEYPPGVADGPQIEANIQYVLNNFTAADGNPFKVIRIPMPPGPNGQYPNFNGDYRTYTNSIIINNTILVPTYDEQYDTTALRIMEEAMPGYNIQGINCNAIIPLSGALHCITKEVGAQHPLWISHIEHIDVFEHQPQGYEIEALIKHFSGISTVDLYYTTDISAGYTMIPMNEIDDADDYYTATIPEQNSGSTVHYYIKAEAVNGKINQKPMPAPAGYFQFDVEYDITGIEDAQLQLTKVSPNPANDMVLISLDSKYPTEGQIVLYNSIGQNVMDVYQGRFSGGERSYFLDVSFLEGGVYLLSIATRDTRLTHKVIIE